MAYQLLQDFTVKAYQGCTKKKLFTPSHCIGFGGMKSDNKLENFFSHIHHPCCVHRLFFCFFFSGRCAVFTVFWCLTWYETKSSCYPIYRNFRYLIHSKFITTSILKTLFSRPPKLLLSFSTHSVPLVIDHSCPKVVVLYAFYCILASPHIGKETLYFCACPT